MINCSKCNGASEVTSRDYLRDIVCYTFRCSECGDTFLLDGEEIITKVHNSEDLDTCPKCGDK